MSTEIKTLSHTLESPVKTINIQERETEGHF